MSCEHDCTKPPVFPKPIFNRPGLDRIDYRIGGYAELREYMLDALNKAPELSAWTHREPDDPGIALLESAAVVGDILSFYQSLYANELYLRTAEWRESVAELVRLLGYRLAPGLGGDALFALAVKGEEAVTVPKGFGLKAQLEGQEKPAEFESTGEVVAYPQLGEFHLYRPRLPLQNVTAGLTRLEVQAVDGKTDVASTGALALKTGDRIMLVPESGMFDGGIAVPDRSLGEQGGPFENVTTFDFELNDLPFVAQDKAEIVVVEKVERILDRTVIIFKGSLREDRGTTVTAYKLGRSFRHFGHNAPVVTTTFNDSDQTLTVANTDFVRNISAIETHFSGSWYDVSVGTDIGLLSNDRQARARTSARFGQDFNADINLTDFEASHYSTLLETDMPLDQQADDLALGGKLICQGLATWSGQDTPERFTVVKTVTELRQDTLVWGNLNGASTVMITDSKLITKGNIVSATSDIRRMQFHETVGPTLTLRAPSAWNSGAFTDTALSYYGTQEQVLALAGRALLLVGPDGSLQQATVTSQASNISSIGKDEVNPWMWALTLDQAPQVPLDDFDEAEPGVTVYGNLVPATQGKTQTEVVLGSGDQRQAFQTFALPKAPLTYLLDETQTPAQVPELHVYVEGIEWTRVDTFFDARPDEAVYVVREDEVNASYVQFGDGKTGRRLSSGVNNVMAVYRVGQGAYGPLKTGASPQATGRLASLGRVFLPAPVTGGAQPEGEENARRAAPGRMQSLGRIVSLADTEAEALAIPNVIKVRAAWMAPEGIPLLQIVVLTESGAAADVTAVEAALQTYNRCRGPARYPIEVIQGIRQFAYLRLEAGFETARRLDDLEAAIKAALGVSGEEGNGIDGSQGLFGLEVRQFGQGLHQSQIIAATQNVPGVTWVRLKAAQNLALGTPPESDPTGLTKPTLDIVNSVLACAEDRLLALHTTHFTLSLAADEAMEVCPA